MKLTTTHAIVGKDFGFNGMAPLAEPPKDFPSGKTSHVEEEVVESFLALHLSELIGVPAVTIFRAPPLWAAEDLLALDVLGRLHLFEVKKGRIKQRHVQQLNQYLLGYVFADVQTFCEERVKQQQHVAFEGLAALLAGAYAGIGVRKLGVNEVVQRLGADAEEIAGHLLGHPIRTSWWDTKCSATDKAELRAKAILHSLRADGQRDLPTWSDIKELAERWTDKLGATGKVPIGAYMPKRPLVMWLVGTGLGEGDASAESGFTRWRRSGIDARYLGLEVRRDPGAAQWLLRIEREDYAERDTLERRLVEIASTANEGSAPILDMWLYAEASPSQQDKNHRYGKPLGKAARAVYTLPNGTPIEISGQ